MRRQQKQADELKGREESGEEQDRHVLRAHSVLVSLTALSIFAFIHLMSAWLAPLIDKENK